MGEGVCGVFVEDPLFSHDPVIPLKKPLFKELGPLVRCDSYKAGRQAGRQAKAHQVLSLSLSPPPQPWAVISHALSEIGEAARAF